MKAFITDGNNRAALAITRALGKAGAEVIVGAETQPSLAGVSKFCKLNVRYPSPQSKPHRFLEHVLDVARSLSPDILLPVSDITTMTLSAHADSLHKYCSVPFAPYEIPEIAADKVKMLKIAENIGISVPRSIVLQSSEHLHVDMRGLSFPIVVKPHKSRIMIRGRWQSTSVQYASNPEALNRILSDTPNEHYPVLLQERILGPGVGIFLCLHQGEVVASFRHQRLREKPPSGGVSVLRVSAPPIHSLTQKARDLLNKIGWQGVAMVEFKLDQTDNTYKFMEINGRFWGSLQLAIDAGVNFPVILSKIGTGEKVDPINTYKIGVKTRWFIGDLDSLLIRLFRSSQLTLPRNCPSKARMLCDFLRFVDRDLHYEVMRVEDIKPWLYELKDWLYPSHS